MEKCPRANGFFAAGLHRHSHKSAHDLWGDGNGARPGPAPLWNWFLYLKQTSQRKAESPLCVGRCPRAARSVCLAGETGAEEGVGKRSGKKKINNKINVLGQEGPAATPICPAGQGVVPWDTLLLQGGGKLCLSPKRTQRNDGDTQRHTKCRMGFKPWC